MLLARESLRRAALPGAHALTVGVFDGVHRGHQALVARTVAEARSRGIGAGIITFHPSPVTVLRPETPFFYLTSLEERVALLRGLPGVDFVAVVEFTSDLAQVRAADFMAMLVEEGHMRTLVVGEDFALGRGREGTVPLLTELGVTLGYEVVGLPLIANGGERISSTRVRQALAAGDMEDVAALLGRPYTLHGPVLHGDERGRQIGFPTVNLGVTADRALPPNGVYATRATVGTQRLIGSTNIGVRPTFNGHERRVETHLLDFEGDLYDQVVTVELHHRIRDEQRFESVDALVAQIRRDVDATRAYFA